jgi:hypothetical protein
VGQHARSPQRPQLADHEVVPGSNIHGHVVDDERLHPETDRGAEGELLTVFTAIESLSQFAGSARAAMREPGRWLENLARAKAKEWLASYPGLLTTETQRHGELQDNRKHGMR